MAHHKRSGPKSTRAGCMCGRKADKNGCGIPRLIERRANDSEREQVSVSRRLPDLFEDDMEAYEMEPPWEWASEELEACGDFDPSVLTPQEI